LKAHELLKQIDSRKVAVQLPDKDSLTNRLDIQLELRKDDSHVCYVGFLCLAFLKGKNSPTLYS